MSLRIIDAGTVPWLDSQVIYHAVASAMTGATEDTLTLVNPASPYVCLGYHQELDKEADVSYCEEHGLPITRRQVGGGAVYLDRNQLFWHFIVHRARAPYHIEEVYSRYLAGPVNALREMGIPAVHRPVNDIQVEGRKIGGTGAASIGEAMVVVGSLIYDFDYEVMSRVLKVPSEKFRDKVYQSLREYLSTIRRELGDNAPSWDEGKRILIRQIAETLGVDVHFDTLTEREQREMVRLREIFSSKEWVDQAGGLKRHGVKISEGVHVREAAYKAPGGLIRATIRVRENLLDDVTLSGDFFIYPQDTIGALEQALAGSGLEQQELRERVALFWQDYHIQAPGVTPDDVARVIMLASSSP